MKHTTISLDLAKNIIQVCQVSTRGEIVINKAMSPQKLALFLAKTKPCLVPMEACAGFHDSARLAHQHCHHVKDMLPKPHFTLSYLIVLLILCGE